MSRTARMKKQAGMMMAAGIALAALLLCAIFFLPPAGGSRGERILQKMLLGMEQLQDYSLTITEKGPQHELSFRGLVEQGVELKGTLPEFKLEVRTSGNLLLLKHQQDPEWCSAERMGLEGLAGFLVAPLDLLRGQKEGFRGATMGEAVELGETDCRTVYFPAAGPDAFVQRLFPQIDSDAVDEVIIGAAVSEPDTCLRQLRILVEFGENRGEKIERCYYIEP